MSDQLDLFGPTPPAPDPERDYHPRFDRPAAEALANEGMSKALRAQRVQEWRSLADDWLYSLSPGETFTADDVARAVGLPDLPGEGINRNNVVGGWINLKSRAGVIFFTGRTVKSARPERHGNTNRVWCRAA